MNERIKELWEQANIRHVNDYALSGKPREEWRSVPEMFAELIVQECAGICDALQDIPATEPRHCAEDIRIHFGVTEE